MKVHTVWRQLRKPPRKKIRRLDDEPDRLRWFEWWFLIAGLALVDIFIWYQTGIVLWQANAERTFGLKLRADVSTPAAAPQPRSSIVGRLEIPQLGLNAMVQEGVDAGTLRRAVGHLPGTALPGERGNVALAGHRDTFFRPLRNIRHNDLIELETLQGNYRYRVESAKIVRPSDVTVLQPTGRDTLTLITCYPFYYVGSAPKRFVVRARLMPAPASPTSSPEPDTEHNPGHVASLTQ
jgi:sortase A